jgi:hypothetical protein
MCNVTTILPPFLTASALLLRAQHVLPTARSTSSAPLDPPPHTHTLLPTTTSSSSSSTSSSSAGAQGGGC